MKHPAISILTTVFLATTVAGQVKFLDESFEYNHDHPAVGHWLGNLHVEDQWWYGVLGIKHDHEDGWSAGGIVVPPNISFVAVGAQCKDVTITNGHIEFTVPGQIGGTARMTGDISDDGQAIRRSQPPVPAGDHRLRHGVRHDRDHVRRNRPERYR